MIQATESTKTEFIETKSVKAESMIQVESTKTKFINTLSP